MTVPSSREAWPLALLVILGVSWGLRVTLVKIAATSGLEHVTIVATTTVGVAIGLFVLSLLRNKLVRFTRQRLVFFAVCALLGYVIPWFLLMFAAARVPAATLSVLLSMIPIATACVAVAFRTDRWSVSGFFAAVLGTIAVALLVAPEFRASNFGTVAGVFVALSATVVYGLYFNYAAARWPDGLDTVQVASAEVLVAVPLMVPIYIVAGAEAPFFGEWGAGEWAIVVLIALFMLDIYFYFESLRLSGPLFTSNANYVMVVAGVLWGMILLGEQPAEWLWASLVLVFAALIVLERERHSDQLP